MNPLLVVEHAVGIEERQEELHNIPQMSARTLAENLPGLCVLNESHCGFLFARRLSDDTLDVIRLSAVSDPLYSRAETLKHMFDQWVRYFPVRHLTVRVGVEDFALQCLLDDAGWQCTTGEFRLPGLPGAFDCIGNVDVYTYCRSAANDQQSAVAIASKSLGIMNGTTSDYP